MQSRSTIAYPFSPPSTGYTPVVFNREEVVPARLMSPIGVMPGQVRGRVVDSSGAALPGTTLRLLVGHHEATVISGSDGDFVFSGVPQGQVEITAFLAGFTTQRTTFAFDGRPRRIEIPLAIGAITETVTVLGQTAVIDTTKPAPPSLNVVNLQARAAGVLPIRVDVPRAGVSHQFIKPFGRGHDADRSIAL